MEVDEGVVYRAGEVRQESQLDLFGLIPTPNLDPKRLIEKPSRMTHPDVACRWRAARAVASVITLWPRTVRVLIMVTP